jgi:hypothetical protein
MTRDLCNLPISYHIDQVGESSRESAASDLARDLCDMILEAGGCQGVGGCLLCRG